jgi:hypothetical protein
VQSRRHLRDSQRSRSLHVSSNLGAHRPDIARVQPL